VPPISEGDRVVCQKEGVFKDRHGTVEQVWNGVALVQFRNTSIIEPVDYFEET